MTDLRNFSESSNNVIKLAQEEARRLGHNFIGREQLLTALLVEENGAARLLKEAGVTLETVRAEVQKIIGRGSGFVASEIPFTPNAKRALEQAIHIARKYQMRVEPEHILLTIINSPGVALRVLENLRVDPEQLKQRSGQELSKLLQQQPSSDVEIGSLDWLKIASETTKARLDNLLERLEELQKTPYMGQK